MVSAKFAFTAHSEALTESPSLRELDVCIHNNCIADISFVLLCALSSLDSALVDLVKSSPLILIVSINH
jgi:hypothetical protein